MKKTALALVSALLLVAACSSDSSDDMNAAGNGTGTNGTLGVMADGTNVGDRVFFALDSSVLDGASQATLDRQAAWLKANSSTSVVVEGHADERGTREYNLALGERRASAAKNYLVSTGVSAGMISTVSYGKERPSMTGSDESAWGQNRRAVTVIAN